MASSLSYSQTLKFAAIAPEGTTLADVMVKLAKVVKQKTNGKVKIKNYLGGVQGDEPDVMRKMRINSLSGGFFTGKFLGNIQGGLRILEVPFNFLNDSKKATSSLKNSQSWMSETLKKNKFTNLGVMEIGSVYVVTTKKVKNLKEFQGLKIWAWEGDPLVAAMISAMKLVSVSLPLPSVLQGFESSMIEAAYAPPLGILALQWNSKIKYLINFPTAYSIGAILINDNDKNWKKVSTAHKKIIKDEAKKLIEQANTKTQSDNEQGLAVLKEQGVEFIDFPKSDFEQIDSVREKVISELMTNKFFNSQDEKKLNKLKK